MRIEPVGHFLVTNRLIPVEGGGGNDIVRGRRRGKEIRPPRSVGGLWGKMMLNGIIVESVSVPGGSGIERGHRDTAIDCRPRNLPGSVLELQEIACAGNADQGADSHND